MTEAQCLCDQCKMTVEQCRGKTTAKKPDAVLDELWNFCELNTICVRGDMIEFSGNGVCLLLKLVLKIKELRTKEREQG